MDKLKQLVNNINDKTIINGKPKLSNDFLKRAVDLLRMLKVSDYEIIEKIIYMDELVESGVLNEELLISELNKKNVD